MVKHRMCRLKLRRSLAHCQSRYSPPTFGFARSIAMRDTGPGLSPQSLSRLFEPFYTTKPEGMGMGLSICRSIIEAHGGRLWAIPCEPQGALFQFTLPAGKRTPCRDPGGRLHVEH